MNPAAPKRSTHRLSWLAALVALVSTGTAGVLRASRAPAEAPAAGAPAEAAPAPLPARLSETGLFAAGSVTDINPRNLAFAPQYPLWTDGATKRRWVRLPEGAAIDASNPDAWQFPAGTRFWKEFNFGRRTETRYMERLADGSFRYATYVWAEDGSDAFLADAASSTLVTTALGAQHEVPSESDCRACHEGRKSPILGFGALQLSSDRDPNAPHAEPMPEGGVDLQALAARGLLRGLPERLLRVPPRIRAASPTARAALGYLYGNCSGCHNAEGQIASVGLDFDVHVGTDATPGALRTALGQPSRFLIPGASETLRIAPGKPEASALAFRMSTRFPAAQMPPLGTRRVDDQALALVNAFITDLAEVSTNKGKQP